MATTSINGTAGNDLIAAHSDSDYLKGKLVVVLGATPSQGGWPHPNIIVNGQVLARDVPITSYILDGHTQVVTVSLPTDVPVTSVAIQYWDDNVTPSDDRNVYVGSVTLNGVTLPLDAAVYTRSDYPTIPGQHDMDWNGFMTWSGTVVSNAMAGGMTVDSHVIDGLGGADLVTYQGRETDYTVRYTTDGAITVSSHGGQFSDALWNVENVLFDDRAAYGGGFDAHVDLVNDTIDGGTGLDTLVLGGKHTDYVIPHTTTGFSVSGPGVNEWVTNVERLQFSDGVVGLDISGDAGQAYRLYQAAFNRVPDLGGLGYQTNALDTGTSLVQVAANFIASPEFQATYGSVDDREFITLLYRNVLHREPEQAGLDFHMNELASGETRADVLTHFSESPENQANVIGQIQDGMFFYPVA
jgi:hypothetical protein